MSILFHIGLHKTASSTLAKQFFIPDHGFSQPAKNREWVLKLFVDKSSTSLLDEAELKEISHFVDEAKNQNLYPVISHERLSGYPLSGGYDRLDITQRLKNIDEEVKVLLIIREQKSWTYSAWKQAIIDGHSLSLQEFLAPKQHVTSRIPQFRKDYLCYHSYISHLHEQFGRANVCVLPMEMLSMEPLSFGEHLTTFLGHDHDVNKVSLKPVNQSRKLSGVYFNWFFNKCIISSQQTPFGFLKDNGAIARLLRRGSLYVCDRCCEMPLSSTIIKRHKALIKEEIGLHYRESNQQTSSIIGIDLAAFGYDQ